VKTKISSLIALLCILVYVVTVLFAAFQIYANILEQQQTGTRELDKVQSLITQNGEVFFTEPLRENIRKTLEESKVLQGLIIKSDPSSGTATDPKVFENGWGSAIRWDNGPQFVTRLGYTTLPPRIVTIPGFGNVSLYSMIKAVQYDFMADILKQTLLVILATLLLSFLTMVTSMLRSKEKLEKTDPLSKKNDTQKTSARQPFAQQRAGVRISEERRPAPPINDTIDTSIDDGIDDDINDIINDDDMFDDDIDDINVDDVVIEDETLDEPGINIENEMTDESIDLNNEDFSLPEFDDESGSETQTGGLPEDDFHLDDFVDENALNLPEVASIDDVGDIGSDNSFNLPEVAAIDDIDDIGDIGGLDDDSAGTEDALFDDADYSLDAEPIAEPEPARPAPGAAAGTDGASGPSGLYSPQSNVGWEAYTQERLASELHRCAASEQDLVIMLMECAASVNCEGKLYKKIADEAIDLFNLKDLTFEYGKRGFTVIIPNANLTEGINKAREFHDRIFKTCYDFFQKTNDFMIGLSSRSGRLVEADKLLHEAARALEKARTEPETPVIAFKSDPEKYRDYIRRSSF
jgi:hypothetical protein